MIMIYNDLPKPKAKVVGALQQMNNTYSLISVYSIWEFTIFGAASSMTRLKTKKYLI